MSDTAISKEMTDRGLLELEKRAMVGDRSAVLHLVSLCRSYRQAVRAALEARWADGAIDGVASARLGASTDAAELSAAEAMRDE